MNLVLLFQDDFVSESQASLTGRRLEHITNVHRARIGDQLVVGLLNGRIGRGTITAMSIDRIDLDVQLDQDPPPALPLTLILALPRPKVLNRTLAAAASLGIKRIVLLNAWRVEKSYWKTPKLEPENIRHQLILGLEQAKDTVLPVVETKRFFASFVKEQLPEIARDSRLLVAHPYADVGQNGGQAGSLSHTVLVIGPEGGFIEEEIASFERAGAQRISLGPRILRVETAVPALVAKLFL